MKRLFLALILITTVNSAWSQTNGASSWDLKQKEYFEAGYIIKDNGRSYDIDNIMNVLGGQPYKLLDGTPTPRKETYHAIPNQTKKESLDKAFREVFTPAEIEQFKDEYIAVGVYINTKTGKIDELGFLFSNTSPLYSLPPSKFKSLESKLKSYITFTIPESSKEIQIVKMTFVLYFKHLL